MLQIAITEAVRLCTGGIKRCNFFCRRHEGVWSRAVQIHTFLLSQLHGTHRSGSLVGSCACLVVFENRKICSSQREFNKISRPILMTGLMIWGQIGQIEFPNSSRRNMFSLIIAAVLMATTDAQTSNYCLICDDITMCKHPTTVRT